MKKIAIIFMLVFVSIVSFGINNSKANNINKSDTIKKNKMKNQIIELAIRSHKTTVSTEEFETMKDIAVKSLVAIKNVGPEREFDPIINIPEYSEKEYIGTTRYKSMRTVYKGMFNIKFIRNLMKLLKMSDVVSGTFQKPEDPSFDYINFANKENIVEISVLRPRDIKKKDFLQKRAEYLKQVEKEDEIKSTHAFKTKWGFKNADVIVHFTVYKNKQSYEQFMQRSKELDYVKGFNSVTSPLIISYCTVIK